MFGSSDLRVRNALRCRSGSTGSRQPRYPAGLAISGLFCEIGVKRGTTKRVIGSKRCNMPAGFSNPFYGDGPSTRTLTTPWWLTAALRSRTCKTDEAQQNPNLLSSSQVRGMQTWSPWSSNAGRGGLYAKRHQRLAAQNRGARRWISRTEQIAAQQQDLASMLRSRAQGNAELAEMMLGREREQHRCSRSAAASMQA